MQDFLQKLPEPWPPFCMESSWFLIGGFSGSLVTLCFPFPLQVVLYITITMQRATGNPNNRWITGFRGSAVTRALLYQVPGTVFGTDLLKFYCASRLRFPV